MNFFDRLRNRPAGPVEEPHGIVEERIPGDGRVRVVPLDEITVLDEMRIGRELKLPPGALAGMVKRESA